MFELDDEPFARPSFADDLAFLARLPRLDRDLAGTPGGDAPRMPERAAPESSLAQEIREGPPPRVIQRPRVPVRRSEDATHPPTDEASDGLDVNPFAAAPDSKFLYHSTAHDRATLDVMAAIVRRDNFITVTGAAGSGKTTLCHAIAEELDRKALTSFVDTPFKTLTDLLKQVLVDFGVIAREDLLTGPLAGATLDELTTALKEFVAPLAILQVAAVILIDQAERLSPGALYALGGLPDALGGAPLLQIVLVGQSELLTTLERADVRSLATRIAARVEMQPLLPDEIASYVTYRLRVGGRSARVEFEEPAFGELWALSHGNPRTLNAICERALELGHRVSAGAIDGRLIEAAAESLNFELPPRRSQSSLLPVLAFVLLVLVGAGAAMWMFRDDLTRIVEQWETVPARLVQQPSGPDGR